MRFQRVIFVVLDKTVEKIVVYFFLFFLEGEWTTEDENRPAMFFPPFVSLAARISRVSREKREFAAGRAA